MASTLMGAIKSGDADAVRRMMIGWRAIIFGVPNLNSADESGNTPLMVACQEHKPDIVRLLLASGSCDYLRQRPDGKAAIDIAKDAGDSEIVVVLADHHDWLRSATSRKNG